MAGATTAVLLAASTVRASDVQCGTGGDGSPGGTGTFFEGAITRGAPPDSTDDAVQADIVAAGYGQ